MIGLSGELRDERAVPNEGIRQSARHALSVGLVAGTLAGVVAGSTCGLAFGPGSGVTAGLGLGLAFALAGAMMFGGGVCLQHYAARAVMVHQGIAPWRYRSFLDAMADRLLLRQSGSAYLFIHRLLRDHFVRGHEKVPTGGESRSPVGQLEVSPHFSRVLPRVSGHARCRCRAGLPADQPAAGQTERPGFPGFSSDLAQRARGDGASAVRSAAGIGHGRR